MSSTSAGLLWSNDDHRRRRHRREPDNNDNDDNGWVVVVEMPPRDDRLEKAEAVPTTATTSGRILPRRAGWRQCTNLFFVIFRYRLCVMTQ